MGCYINPPNKTKEEWLEENGILVSKKQAEQTLLDNDQKKQRLGVVCLVQNRGFSAAGVCFSYSEFLEFSDPADPREKTFYLVPKFLIKELVPDCPNME